MSSRAVLLVARRELLDNVRTKGFWFSIVLVPVMIAAGVIVPVLLAGTKDARPYAVIDQSGFLLKSIDTRARYQDARLLLDVVKERARKGTLDTLEQPLRDVAPAIEGASETQLADVARVLADAEAEVPAPEGERASESAVAAARAKGDAFRSWLDGLTRAEARAIDSELSHARFRRVEDAALDEISLKARLDKGPRELFAYFVIGADPLGGNEGSKYVSNNRTDRDLREWFSGLATESVRDARFAREGVDAAIAARIQEPLRFEEKQVAAGGEESKVGTRDVLRQWAPAGFTYLLWFSVFISAQMLLTNTIEEKSNRLMEVLLSSTSPLDLMIGKTLGTAATGLTIVGTWVLFGVGSSTIVPRLAGAAPGGGLTSILSEPLFLLSFVGYYVLGYLLYSAVFVAIGSLCDSLKDAQNLMQPVSIALVLPLFALLPVAQDPNGGLARILSFVPPFTPFVMMNRAAGPPAAWEYAATFALLIVSIVVAFYLSAKVFRIGVLMTGTPPKLGQLLRWLRAPVGSPPPRRSE